ncbi:ABC transporter substrate-binding protein [Frigoribacterium sp. PhB24]|uniref:ABC transporter substrate-binding protein n=1 Tax=Frigoribacterium sp. PhB24 TaxID=2485204 RepID=UPI000F49B8D6|nr:extracellular solute-binding protein [Frigoribacterium sp. PhB24]ROS48867.1 carbohydrate ABC transporter substrate-binding protein (CUT1 family) [Frigoribacterium sp. PhB24]
MQLSRREVIVGGGALALLGALSSCAAPGRAAASLDYWYYFQDLDQRNYFRKHFIDDYRGSVPVTLTVKSSATIDQLTQVALAAGKGPALVVTPGPSGVAAYDGAGYIAHLDDYVEQYGWDQKFSSWALDASRVGDSLVTLPTSYESMVLYFKPEVVAQHGLTVPIDRAGFVDFCTEAKAKGLVPIAAGNADYKGANEWYLTIALNHDAGPEAVYRALQGETKWTDPVFVDAFQRLADDFGRGWYGGGVKSYFTNQFPKMYQQLASGEAASMISGTWEFSNLAPYFGEGSGNSGDWDYQNVPSLRDGVGSTIWDLGIGQSTGVNTQSGNVPAAVEFLNFLTTDVKTITASMEAMSFQPPPIGLTRADFTASADPRMVRLYTELPVATTIGYTTWTFFPQKTETYMINEYEKVLTGSMTAAEFASGMQDIFAGELAAGSVPVAPKPSELVS